VLFFQVVLSTVSTVPLYEYLERQTFEPGTAGEEGGKKRRSRHSERDADA